MRIPLVIVVIGSTLSSFSYGWLYDEPVLLAFASGLCAGMALLGLLLGEIDWDSGEERLAEHGRKT